MEINTKENMWDVREMHNKINNETGHTWHNTLSEPHDLGALQIHDLEGACWNQTLNFGSKSELPGLLFKAKF